MSNLIRKMERQNAIAEEKTKQKELKALYGKRPKQTCPRCKKQSLFFTNKDGETFCVRCDSKIAVGGGAKDDNQKPNQNA